MRTRVKICGITNAEDLSHAVSAGVDAVGFNMYEGSPRYLDPDSAAILVAAVPAFVCRTGLFVNHASEAVRAICARVRLDLLQFHGDEPDDFCASFGQPFIKVIRVGKDTDVMKQASLFPSAIGLMLDARVEQAFGGTGICLDWRNLPRLDKPTILAGGLSPDNVAEAIRLVQPYGVDVSSGVELSRGKKDEVRIRAFASAVRNADEAFYE